MFYQVRSTSMKTSFYSNFQHVSGNYTAKCSHSSRIKNGMTIELRRSTPRLPEKFSGNEIIPFVCYSQLGALHIHSKESFVALEAAFVFNNEAFFFALTPKITTSDDSLRDFTPSE